MLCIIFYYIIYFIHCPIYRLQVQSSVSVLERECGVITFAHTGPGDYFAYYLPHYQTGGGAGVHFSWFNCTDPLHGRKCVL